MKAEKENRIALGCIMLAPSEFWADCVTWDPSPTPTLDCR